MLDVKYYINGDEVNPSNHQEVSIQVNFDHDSGSPTPSVSTNKWTFVDNDAKILNDHIDTGLNGGVGIHEGVPFKIQLTNGNKSLAFDKYLDLSADDTIISCDEIEVGSVDYANIDWLNSKADSISMAYLQEQTSLLPRSKAIAVPYIINSIPNYKDAMICSISIFVMEQAIEKAISEMTGTAAATGGVFNAGGEVLRAIAQIAYIILLLLALIKLIKDLIDLIIQPVKYHAVMYVLDQVKAGCAFLGLEFKSTILEAEPLSRSVILPEKYRNPKMSSNSKLLGFDIFNRQEQNGYYNGTLGDLLRELKKIFRAKLVFEGNVLRLEKQNYKAVNSASYTIPDILNTKYTTNASKIVSNYLLEFSVDFEEKNTIQEYSGTILQAITQPKIVSNPKLNLIKNFERNTIGFALAKVKTELTGPEEAVKDFFKVIDKTLGVLIDAVNALIALAKKVVELVNKIIKAINTLPGVDIKKISTSKLKPIKKPNLGGIINDRIGMLLLETDVVTTPKIFILKKGNKDRQNIIDSANSTIYNARWLWDNFHNEISHVPTTSNQNGNQWIQKSIENVPFTFDDLLKVINNVPIFDALGNVARVITLDYNIWEQLANIKYEINKKYTDNLKLTLHDGIGY